LREKIIANGVKNLREFGYPNVNEQNIFTDIIYRQFFKRMLEDNIGFGHDKLINEMISEIKEE